MVPTYSKSPDDSIDSNTGTMVAGMKEAEIRQMLEAKGYTFDGIVHFNKKDRIRWHNKDIKVSLNLGKKIESISTEDFKIFVV